MGRSWFSPGRTNLLFSVLLRPKILPDDVFLLTMIVALGAIDAIGELYALKAMIKWPNDIYVGRKKLGGILTEFSTWGNAVEYVVLGLGLNVNWKPGDKEGLLYPTTSMQIETGVKVSRGDLLVKILDNLEAYYRKIFSGWIERLYQRWNEKSMILHKRVEVTAGKDRICGTAMRIDPKGALIVLDDRGQEQKIVCGDVSVKEIDV